MDIEEEYSHLKGPSRWWAQWRWKLRDFYDRHPLLRHFIHEPLFLLAIGSVVLASLAVPFTLSKRWRPAPPHFSKSVSVSLLDYGQAWALRRSAEQARKAGRWEDALGAVRGAIGNNLADGKALRMALEILRDGPSVKSENLSLMLLVSNLLLELGRTNRADSALVAQVYERFRLPDYGLAMLRPWEGELNLDERATWLRCLATSGRSAQFQAIWKTNAPLYSSNRVMQIYAAGADAISGVSMDRLVPALGTLREGLKDPELRLSAARLLGGAAFRRNDVVDYERAIATLREASSAMVFDDVLLWQLLAQNGRRAEARDLAARYPNVPPPTGIEAVQLARAWLALGLDELGAKMFREEASRYGLDLEVWSTYLDILTMRGDWKDVRAVASMLRMNTSVRDDLTAIACYADARADISEGRRSSAKDYLRRLKEARIQDHRLAFRIAAGVNQAGEGELAFELLKRIEKDFEHLPEYWIEVLGAAQKLRSVDEMQRASERLLALVPENPTAQMIRLVVLIGARTEPAEALSMSLHLLSRGLKSDGMQINHAMALSMNKRAEEAALVLAGVPLLNLNPADLNSWLVAQVEAMAALGRYREALDAGRSADTSVLLPPHENFIRQLLETCRKKIAAGPTG